MNHSAFMMIDKIKEHIAKIEDFTAKTKDELEQFDGQAALPLRRRLEADVVLGDGDVPAFQILVEPPEGLLDRAGDRVEQAVLRGEVDVDAAHCAVRGRGDPAHGRIPEAVGEELFAGGSQQRSPDVGGRAPVQGGDEVLGSLEVEGDVGARVGVLEGRGQFLEGVLEGGGREDGDLAGDVRAGGGGLGAGRRGRGVRRVGGAPARDERGGGDE